MCLIHKFVVDTQFQFNSIQFFISLNSEDCISYLYVHNYNKINLEYKTYMTYSDQFIRSNA